MAGQIKVAVVSGAISASGTGTADFTKAGFGTPKACIILLSFDTVDTASVAAEGKASIGFSDFTNHRCISHQDEDGSAKVDSDARKSNTKAYVLLDVGGVVDIDGTVNTITDGVRLTNTTNGSASAVFATIIMFGGSDLQVSLDSVTLQRTLDTATTVTTSIDQDLVFLIGVDIAGEDSSSTGVNNSFGVAHIRKSDHAAFVNRCIGWTSDHNNNVGAPSLIIANNRCLSVLTEAAGQDWEVELTAATTTTYDLTTRTVDPGAGMEVYALALNLDDRGSKVGSVESPTSGASWTPGVALGFTPQYVGLGLTHAQVEGTIESDADAGGLGISSNTGSGEETFHGWYNEDASVAANTNNNFRSRVIDFRDHDLATVVHDHSHSSFNSGDWTYTINTENETTARKWFYWAIEEAAAANTTMIAGLGSFALTGQTTDLLWAHLMDGALGSFALTGQDATTVRGFKMDAELGSFALTGQDTEFLRTHVTVAGLGSFTFTGQDAILLWTHLMIGELGSFALTGQDATTAKGSTFIGELGSFALTGQDTEFLRTHITIAGLGTFNVIGQIANTLQGHRLEANLGSFAVTGQDATTFVTLATTLTAEQGSFALTGKDATTTDSGAAVTAVILGEGFLINCGKLLS